MTLLGLSLALLILGAGSLAMVLADGLQTARELRHRRWAATVERLNERSGRIIDALTAHIGRQVNIIRHLLGPRYSTDAGERDADRAAARNYREDN